MTFKKGQSGNPSTQFKKGQSGNPKGPTPGYKTFQVRIKELADKEIDYEDLKKKKVKGSIGEAIVMALIGKSVKGDVAAAKALIEFADGKAMNNVKAEIKLDAMTDLFKSIGAVEDE